MQLNPGTKLQNGKYEIVRTLGQGGFGITYLAEQVALHRKVAIKEFFMKDYCNRDTSTSIVTLGTTDGNKDLVSRFRTKFVREAQMIAALEQPHIVKIHDVFEENGTAYYVMEYLEGDSLADRVKKNGLLPEAEALKYIHQVGDALSYLHSQNCLHFDVKPSNVLINQSRDAVLIDFGVSKHYDEAGSQTSSTPVGISKGYAPLEQYQQNEISTFTPATDIYALGATLYTLLTGKVPPSASEVNEDGLPPLPAAISKSTRGAIEKAMQPRRKDRPQTVEAFLDLLDKKVEVEGKEETFDDEATVIAGGAGVSKPLAENNNQVDGVKPKARAETSTSHSWKIIAIWGVLGLLAVVLAVVFLSRGGASSQDVLTIDGLQEYVAEFESTASEREFAIEKRFKESWTYTGVPEWCSAKGTTGKFTLTVSENTTSEDRTATVVFRKMDGQEDLGRLVISQKGVTDDKTESPGNETVGRARFNSTPNGAQIWLDGKNTKKITPATLENLSPGKHSVELVREGYNDYSASITVTAGKLTTLSGSLIAKEPEKSASVPLGSVKISSTPSGATIWLDGKNTGKTTPEVLENLSPGTYSIKLTLHGYEDYSGRITIASGKRTEASLTLKSMEVSSRTSDISSNNKSNTQDASEMAESVEEEAISFALVEEKPKFQGGDANTFSRWVSQQLNYPEEAKNNGVAGRVMVQFTVKANGSVADVKVLRGVDPSLDREAVRVIQSSPKWTPGRQRDRAVSVTYQFPVIFQLK